MVIVHLSSGHSLLLLLGINKELFTRPHLKCAIKTDNERLLIRLWILPYLSKMKNENEIELRQVRWNLPRLSEGNESPIFIFSHIG